MFAYARLRPGKGFKPDRALKYYTQRLVGLPSARRTISSAIASGIRQRHGDVPAMMLSNADALALGDLRRDGLAVLEPLLSQDQADRMADYFFARDVVGPDGAVVPLEHLPDKVSAAAYPLATVLDCPGVLDVLNAPEVLRIGSHYLGCKPTLSSVGVRWSFPRVVQRTRTQDYHRDLDDWRFFKLFIYLTDVDEETGPHSYVRGSHTTAFGLKAKAYDEDELKQRYGAGKLTNVLGPRGTTFLADTLGIHCGLPPTRRPRLILQIQYSLLPIYAFLYEPAKRVSEPFDPYCNRLLLRQDGP